MNSGQKHKNFKVASIFMFMYFFMLHNLYSQKANSHSEEASKMYLFNDIKEAINQKDDVYRLNIREKNYYNFPAELCVFQNLLFLNAMCGIK